jgi:FAD/FMN-containing dehydrogenase
MFDKAIKVEVLQDFKSHVHGELILPGDDGYERGRRVWNGAIEKYPALIARCTGVSDVVASVQFARAQELAVAIRGGGHRASA